MAMSTFATLNFPYGIADFQTIINQGFYYLDRTDRIRLMENMGHQLLLLRPRRFGKSLWLSTLENYYDLAKADDFSRLFGHLQIGQCPTPIHNNYYVMRWDFSVVDPSGDLIKIRQSLFNHINIKIQSLVAKYSDQLNNVVIYDEDAIASFQSLLMAINRTPYKLYLFIDEYDNFANEVLVSQEKGEARYHELVGSEGLIKTLFKAIKWGANGEGLERVFMTGVTPVVMADITSGYNIIEDISRRSEFNDLCGFHEEEILTTLKQIMTNCPLASAKVEDALSLMRAFYNGYNFSQQEDCDFVYNPTLALYFFKWLQMDCRYPKEMLDSNFAMDRNRIEYVSRLPYGQAIINNALQSETPITIPALSNRFGVQMMLNAPKDHTFLVSLLYYFGVLTYSGQDFMGDLQLVVPNLVVKKLYVEQIQSVLLPGYEISQEREQVCKIFYTSGEIEPLYDFIERRFLPVFDNRDLRWSNELVVKTAFLTTLFNDLVYIMDSETPLAKGYADLSLIIRPDRREYALLDHLLEFKHLKISELPGLGLTSDHIAQMPRNELRALPAVANLLAEAENQLTRYRVTLEAAYGTKLKLRTHAVVCIGLVRLV